MTQQIRPRNLWLLVQREGEVLLFSAASEEPFISSTFFNQASNVRFHPIEEIRVARFQQLEYFSSPNGAFPQSPKSKN